MPIHDWTRVSAGTWHAFHLSWIGEIQLALNNGLLPADYYAQAEQVAGPMGPDVITLQANEQDESDGGTTTLAGESIALALAPPRTRVTAEAEMDAYVSKRRTIVVRHNSGDRIVALIELVSPGNKSSKHGLHSFVDKAIESLVRGYHLLIVDLFPPGPRDPAGIHGEIRSEISSDDFGLPAASPLILASYSAGATKRAFVEPTAVGNVLIDMPLFLTPENYVNVPLESTYQGAFRGVPRKYKSLLEAV